MRTLFFTIRLDTQIVYQIRDIMYPIFCQIKNDNIIGTHSYHSQIIIANQFLSQHAVFIAVLPCQLSQPTKVIKAIWFLQNAHTVNVRAQQSMNHSFLFLLSFFLRFLIKLNLWYFLIIYVSSHFNKIMDVIRCTLWGILVYTLCPDQVYTKAIKLK